MLLGPDDPPPFEVHRAHGTSPYLLIADHAGNRVPKALGDLGIPPAELGRHIGWDLGIAATSRLLADALDAWLIVQTYSRLVIDCNRPLTNPTSIPERSDGTEIPANRGLDAAGKSARAQAIFTPYHTRIEQELDARAAANRPTLFVAMHSFTPVFQGFQRPWHAGVLYHRDARLSMALKAKLEEEPGLVVGNNEPYSVSAESDYAIPVHAEGRSLPYVEFEIRQDLISTPEGQKAWASRLARALSSLAPEFLSSPASPGSS